MLGKDRLREIKHRKCAGRPRGVVADAVVSLVESCGPMTAREIAHRLQLTINAAKFTCSRLHARGDLVVTDMVRIPGSNKPVSKYGFNSGASMDSASGRVLPAAFFARRSA